MQLILLKKMKIKSKYLNHMYQLNLKKSEYIF